MRVQKTVGIAAGMAAIGIALLKYVWDRHPAPYSEKWFGSLTDDELDAERKKVQQAYGSVGGDFSQGARLQNLLWLFDKVIRERDRDRRGEEEYVSPPHREHGWYLPNDE